MQSKLLLLLAGISILAKRNDDDQTVKSDRWNLLFKIMPVGCFSTFLQFRCSTTVLGEFISYVADNIYVSKYGEPFIDNCHEYLFSNDFAFN